MLPVIYKLDKERVLKLGFKAVAKLEKIFDCPMSKWDTPNFSFDHIANVLAESLRHEMPDIDKEKVEDLIDEYSDISTAFKKTYECIGAAFGKNLEAVEAPPQK